MVAPLGTPQPVFLLPPVDQIPDEEEDQPKAGLPLVRHPVCLMVWWQL